MVPPDSCFLMRSSDWGHQKLPLISAESSNKDLILTIYPLFLPRGATALHMWSGSADSNRHCTDFKSALSAFGVHPDGHGYSSDTDKRHKTRNYYIDIITQFLTKVKFSQATIYKIFLVPISTFVYILYQNFR